MSYDSVKKVKHYEIFPEYGLEARHIIERVLELSGFSGIKAHYLGCALKYLLRAGRKGKDDIGKCREYCGYMEDLCVQQDSEEST